MPLFLFGWGCASFGLTGTLTTNTGVIRTSLIVFNGIVDTHQRHALKVIVKPTQTALPRPLRSWIFPALVKLRATHEHKVELTLELGQLGLV